MSREKIIFMFVSELRLTRVPIELSKLFDQVVLGHENASLISRATEKTFLPTLNV